MLNKKRKSIISDCNDGSASLLEDTRNKPGIQTYMNATTDHTVQWTDRKLSEKRSRSNIDEHTAVPTVRQQYGTNDNSKQGVKPRLMLQSDEAGQCSILTNLTITQEHDFRSS